MAMNNLGRVAMAHRGNYSPTYDYVPLDCCYHDGSTYFCKEATTGNAPPNANYWVLMSTSASTVDRDAAEAAAQAAAGSATAAANQVTLAENQVALAQGHATTAGTEATAAAGSASAAADSAGQALASANNAGLSASSASGSATAAATSASEAAQSAASVDGPGLYNAVATHDHSGAVGMGTPINYEHLTGAPPCPYEVGDILTTINEASPAIRWPGTVWSAVEAGRFLVAAGENYSVGATGGTASNVLTVNQLAPHSHTNPIVGDAAFEAGHTALAGRSGTHNYLNGPATNQTGSGAPIENRPPYYAVYMWRRTA